jgi:AraC-like DNA-binding protein
MTPEDYDAWYDAPRRHWIGEREWTTVRDALRLQPSQSVLEVGCGTDWFTRRAEASDPELIRLLQRHVLALETKHEGNLVAQVRAVLRSAILSGHAGEEQVAALLSLHKRTTLHRRLVAEGTQFRVLDAECRYHTARQLLEHSALAIAQIAQTFGYAEASVFTRAFRRWSGTRPTRCRKQHRRG